MADILKKIDEDKEKSTALEDAFKSCRHPDSLSMSLLAADIGVTQEEIEVRLKHFFCFSPFAFLEKGKRRYFEYLNRILKKLRSRSHKRRV